MNHTYVRFINMYLYSHCLNETDGLLSDFKEKASMFTFRQDCPLTINPNSQKMSGLCMFCELEFGFF